MDEAIRLLVSGQKSNARSKFRDGLVLALLSLWPIRRRSIAALTLSHHVEFNSAAVNILLHSVDTKAKRRRVSGCLRSCCPS